MLLHWGVAVRTCNSEQRLEAAADQLRLGEVSLLGVREVAHLECRKGACRVQLGMVDARLE